MANVHAKIGNEKQPIYDDENPTAIYYNAFNDPTDSDDTILPYGDDLDNQVIQEIDQSYLDTLDTYIGARVVVPGKDSPSILGIVKRRKRDHEGNPIGTMNSNPILDSRVYELEFPDRRVEEYSVNSIIENLVEQVDDNGWDQGILQEIIGMRSNPEIAIQKGEHAFTFIHNIIRPVITTKGWDVQV